VIAYEYPWPTNSGSRIRLANTLYGLSRCGPTDLFAIVSDRRADFEDAPAETGIHRHTRIAVRDTTSATAMARSAVLGSAPFEIPLNERAHVSKAVSEFATERYDLVWCFRVRAWVLAGEPRIAPTVVDLDDLEDQKIRARIALGGGANRSLTERARQYLATALWRVDARRWSRLHHRIGLRAAATVVCSEIDAQRASIEGVRVIPNGYDAPADPVGHLQVGSPPTIVFHGTLRYPPNADAARYLVEQVLPRLEVLVPGVRVRLVGLASPEVSKLESPNVTLTGQVPDVTTELSRADLVVVPLRFASGTRVKILEAFAHRIPVVSTTCGAEGLGVSDGVHILLADDPDSLARACARALSDLFLREHMVAAAHELFTSKYRSESMRAEVASLAKELSGR